MNLAVTARCASHVNVLVDGQREDQPFIVIGVIAEQFESAGRLDDVRWCVAEMPPEELCNVGHAELVWKSALASLGVFRNASNESIDLLRQDEITLRQPAGAVGCQMQ